MTSSLGQMRIPRRSGAERFTDGARDLGVDLLAFWQWISSDLIANTTRGVVAEYLVAVALGVEVAGVRDPWAAFDLRTPSGVKVEVKSAACLQSWYQERPSAVAFRTPRTRAWDPATNRLADEPKRQADVYVFALLAHRDKATLNPMHASQWEFYVVATGILDQRTRSQHSITLPTLRRLARGPVSHADLPGAVEEVMRGEQ